MRRFGLLLVAVGLFGFLYCTWEQERHQPVPEGVDALAALRYPAGRYEMGRYAAAFAGLFGVLMLMFPKGR